MTLPRCPSIMGLDLGSRHLGVVVSAEALPLRPLSRRWDVNPLDLGPTADRVRREVDGLAKLDASLPPDVMVEFGALYMPQKGLTPQKARSIADAHKTCERLLDAIWRACPGPYYQVTTITRASWSHRVVPHTAGGITDAMANEGLRTHVDPGMWTALVSQDERDAAGALVGHLLPAPPRSRGKYRDRRRDRTAPRLSPEERVASSRDMRELRAIRAVMVRREKMGTLTADERRAAGCRCIRGHNGGGRCTEDCALALSFVKRHGTRAGSGRCPLCGWPRKGHLRGLPCPVVADGRAPEAQVVGNGAVDSSGQCAV